jgi:thiol:disulfide interchange protein DsbC
MECHSLTPAEAKTIVKDLGDVKRVRMSQIKGLWELTLEKDGRKGVAFLDFAKKNILVGKIFPLKPGKVSELEAVDTPSASNGPTVIDTALIPVESALVLGNPKGSGRLFVFTDPDSPACRKMHKELAVFVKRNPDFAIYILLNPPPNRPDSYEKSRALLAVKSRALLDSAFNGKEIIRRPGAREGRKELDEIVHYARYHGLTEIPSVVLADGRVLPGFTDAASLERAVKDGKAIHVSPTK